MKNKIIIFILIIAMFLIVVGALFKIMHWGFGENAMINGNTILATGLALKVVALVMVMVNYLKSNKK